MKRMISAAIAAIAFALPAFAQERFTAKVVGEGPGVILIPGLASSAATWDATVDQLKGIHRLHVLNVRGFSGEPAGANAEGPVLQPLIDEIAAYAVKLDQPAMIGHSVGGLISLEVAAAKPDAIGRVMVVDALPFYMLLMMPDATVDAAKPFAAMSRKQVLGMNDAQFRAVQEQGLRSLIKTDAARTVVLDWSLKSDRRVVAQVMSEVMTTDARPRLPAIKAPVTVLSAVNADMRSTPEAHAELYTRAYSGLARAAVKQIHDTYHFIPFDQPEAFAKEVREFLAGD